MTKELLDQIDDAPSWVIEEVAEKMKKRGFYVYEYDAIAKAQQELLEEIYYNAIFFAPTTFMKYLNNLFKVKIERWM